MDTPDRQDFPKPHIGAEKTLDRMAEKRSDKAWIDEQRTSKNSRFLLFADLSLAVVSNADKSETELRWYSTDEIQKLGVELQDTLLLGCNTDGHAVFAVSLKEAEAKAVPGGAWTR